MIVSDFTKGKKRGGAEDEICGGETNRFLFSNFNSINLIHSKPILQQGHKV